MNNKKIYFFIILSILTIWICQYIRLNRYYKDIIIHTEKTYASSEIVPFEDDFIEWGKQLSDCSLQVISFEIRNYRNYLNSRPRKWETMSIDIDDKIALVTIEIRNSGNRPIEFPCYDIDLYQVDSLFHLDWNATHALNPNVDSWTFVKCDQQSKINITLAYTIPKNMVSHRLFYNLPSSKFFLCVTSYPTQKSIILHTPNFVT